MKLNLGCGNRKISDWDNVDKIASCNPDQLVDLEKLPWPWPDDSVDEVVLIHVLEHLGAASDVYLGIIKELYRVCCNDALIKIVVPHPRHDDFLGDPTHVRAITPAGLSLFSQKENRGWIAQGAANTPLGIYLGVDFSTQSITVKLDEPWKGRHNSGELSYADLNYAMRTYNNVVTQTEIVIRAIKPAGRLG